LKRIFTNNRRNLYSPHFFSTCSKDSDEHD